jgi:hypothetical protein
MTFKRLLMPMVVLGIIVTMGTAYGQPVVSCSILSTAAAVTTVNGGGNSTDPGTANATTSFAALGPTSRATATGHTEPAAAGPNGIPPNPGGGRVRITCTNPDAANAATPGVVVLTVSYGVPITNTQTHPSSAAGIRVMNGTGAFIAAGPGATSAGTTTQAGANVGISAVNNSSGTIVIGLGTPNAVSSTITPQNPTTGITFPAASVSTFDLEGVLLSTNGKSGNIVATLSSAGGVSIAANAGAAEVITAVLPGLVDPTIPTGTLPAPVLALGAGLAGGAAVLNSAGTAVKGNFTLRIQENYQDVFREASQFNNPGIIGTTGGVFPPSPSSDVQVNVVLSNIPAGLNISNCAAALTDVNGTATVGSPTVSQANITAASPILTVNFNQLVDLNNVDVLWVSCATVGVGTATLPLPSTPVSAQVTLGPTGAALSSTSTALTTLSSGQIPRYQQLLQPTTPLTVVVFPPSNTNLLLTFGAVSPGYNTGLAIANTTVDPFTPAAGGAQASEGTVTFLLVKNDGTSKSYTTSSTSPGSGLTAGVVKSGSTYVVNVSELLSAASFGTTFTGYIFITANFTFAHGAATIYTTSNGAAALSSPVLVLPAVSSAATRGTPESLGQ